MADVVTEVTPPPSFGRWTRIDPFGSTDVVTEVTPPPSFGRWTRIDPLRRRAGWSVGFIKF